MPWPPRGSRASSRSFWRCVTENSPRLCTSSINLSDVAFTLACGRENFSKRKAFKAANREELLGAIRSWLSNGTVFQLDSDVVAAEAGQGPEINPAGRRFISLPTYPFARE